MNCFLPSSKGIYILQTYRTGQEMAALGTEGQSWAGEDRAGQFRAAQGRGLTRRSLQLQSSAKCSRSLARIAPKSLVSKSARRVYSFASSSCSTTCTQLRRYINLRNRALALEFFFFGPSCSKNWSELGLLKTLILLVLLPTSIRSSAVAL